MKMDEKENPKILALLSNHPANEPQSTSNLRDKAHELISAGVHVSPDSDDTLPTTLLDLLTLVIKPLFTKANPHPSLTSTGRKRLVSGGGGFNSRFTGQEDDDEGKGKWKTDFVVPLLRYILKSYEGLSSEGQGREGGSEDSSALPSEQRKTPVHPNQSKEVIESQFFLLVPPLLNMIDDGDPVYKASGADLLRELCEVLRGVNSDIVRRTGLFDVFVDALRGCCGLLPSLTPEEDSLVVMRAVYPAYLGLIDSGGTGDSKGEGESETNSGSGSARKTETDNKNDTKTDSKTNAGIDTGADTNTNTTANKNTDPNLTWLYRHGIIAGIQHLSSSGSFSSTISASLTGFLLSQIPPVFERMGIASVRHFQGLLPMLRAGLMDPFILAAQPEDMVFPVLDVLECVIRVGAPRVRDRWWPEILRGVVGCWCNCVDESHGARLDKNKKGGSDEGRDRVHCVGESDQRLDRVMERLKDLVKMLGAVVEREEWDEAVERLVAEESDLRELFGR